MKKLLIAAIVMMGFMVSGMAQTAPAAKANDQSAKHAAKLSHMKQSASKTTDAAPAVSSKANTATSSAGEKTALKKDGSPDMRYKANKDHAKNTGVKHLKKDGTADKRYKENKKHS
ncbi:MAG: hypothetical protein JNL51_16800 [Chitinophagaceae bacterium]|nr:hypothetical protein [Chitinophagaceae bacterium]